MKTTILRLSLAIIVVILVYYFSSLTFMEILTLLAVIVALFKDDLYSFFVPPRLVITASSGPSHFNVAPVLDRGGNVTDNVDFFGVIVENKGLGKAKNVELLFNGLESNILPNFDRFISLPLVRSWTHYPTVSVVYNSVPIRFDICFIRESVPEELHFSFFSTPNDLLNVFCARSEESFFEFEVVALSQNASLARRRVRITYDGNDMQGFNVT